jgi:hypothetical protein
MQIVHRPKRPFLISTWSWAATGDAAVVEFKNLHLLRINELWLYAELVTKSVSGTLLLQASVDNGANYVTSYTAAPSTGAVATSPGFSFFHGTDATAARSGWVQVMSPQLSGVPKLAFGLSLSGALRAFDSSLEPINAVKVVGSNGGNLTGGKIYCFAT